MGRVNEMMQPTFGKYEYKYPIKRIVTYQIVVLMLSFFLVWYKVWWETLVNLFAALFGFLATRDPTTEKSLKFMNAYLIGNIVSVILQTIALIVLMYSMFETHILDAIIGSNTSPAVNWMFHISILIVVAGHMVLSGFGLKYGYEFRMELLDNPPVSEAGFLPLTSGSSAEQLI